MVLKLKGLTYKITHVVAANIPRLPNLVPNNSSDILLDLIVIM